MAIQEQNKEEEPLNILIAGSGIGGLTAAVAFIREGHNVTLFEQSQFSNETGAAIHLAPNGNGILRKIGLFSETIGGNSMLGFREYSMPAATLKIDIKSKGDIWQNPWQLVHRVHLHQTLKKMALEPKKGKPAKLETRSRVVDVDVESATITLESGEKISGDVVIGADGVHSKTRACVPGGDVKPFSSGKSAFRFLIPRKTLLDDPETKDFVENKGILTMFIGEDRRFVMYPCSNNELLNFVAMHPSNESDASDEWNAGGSKESMSKIYKDFGPKIAALISHIDAKGLKLWSLLDMKVLPHWVNGKLALMGDAAHPFLPHQGQGGGQAIEDAASLATVLGRGTPREEIPERLKLYQKCRQARANRIQEVTRLAGRDMAEIAASDGKPLDMNEFTVYNFGHDEFDHSSRMLREWKNARNPHVYKRMPTAFGPMPGPRQDIVGRPRRAAHSTFLTSSIKFKTSRTLLQNLLPNDQFDFWTPGTVAYASFSNTTLNRMDWLGGGGYSHMGLYIHGIKYTKKDGSILKGTFLPILFENLADPIITGREELGMPKLFCSLDSYRRDSSMRIRAGWQGANFGELEWEGLEKVEETSVPASVVNGAPVSNGTPGEAPPGGIPGVEGDGMFVYRYIPTVGEPGKADAEYPVWVPDNAHSEARRVSSTWRAKTAKFSFAGKDWDSLPTLHHIATGLGDIPMFEVVEAKIIEGTGVSDVGQARKIE
ncbi:hypothetical protein FKW77_003743 [Venturia effusa]|uniref:FAD-binding domain-containing protein n=1 Tax=Venturia effusa TaxID=50376 RepID=A0A517LF86_9PEZI|nr:hypothetical protein FKW77_003743 [Venturia effusa]